MTYLNDLGLFIQPVRTNISSDTFHPLRKLPLRVFTFTWVWSNKVHSTTISKDAFAPLTGNITFVQTAFSGLPVVTSLRYPCQTLIVTAESRPGHLHDKLDKDSLQILQKWNASLEKLGVHFLNLERIEEHAFVWISHICILDLSYNEINYVAKNAFYGLICLEQLILASNLLIHIPFDAFEVFRRSASLQYLDLSSNGITNIIDMDSFSAVSTALSYLNLEINYIARIVSTHWIGLLENLKHLTLTCRSNLCHILMNSERLLPLLQTIQISNFQRVEFERPLCISFPSLEVNRWSTHIDTILFPLLGAIEGCRYLKELELSGTLRNTNLVDFKHLKINMSTLEILTLTRNKIISVKLLFFIDAPKLEYLNLAMNRLKTIDSEIANEYPDLINLNIQNNELTSLSGLEHLSLLKNLMLLQTKSLKFQLGCCLKHTQYKHLF